MLELDRFKSAPPSYVMDYAYLFAGGRTEFAQRHGANIVKLTNSVGYVDGMPHTTWKLFARIAQGDGEARWMGPVVSVTHVNGNEMVYVEDFVDPRIPSGLTLNPQGVLLDVLFERSFTNPGLHLAGDLDT